MTYRKRVLEVRKTDAFVKWIDGLRDIGAAARIQLRIERLELGNPGDVRPVGAGVSEMRINYGPGYRVYFVQRGSVCVLLLCGGDKRTQVTDIARAKSLAEEWDNGA